MYRCSKRGWVHMDISYDYNYMLAVERWVAVAGIAAASTYTHRTHLTLHQRPQQIPVAPPPWTARSCTVSMHTQTVACTRFSTAGRVPFTCLVYRKTESTWTPESLCYYYSEQVYTTRVLVCASCVLQRHQETYNLWKNTIQDRVYKGFARGGG